MNHWLAFHGEVGLKERPRESRYGVRSSLSINLMVKRYDVNFLKKIDFSLETITILSKILFWKLIFGYLTWILKRKWVAFYCMFPINLFSAQGRQNHRDYRKVDQQANIYALLQCCFCYVGLPVKSNHYSIR